jgi:uncharacterized protein (TIGR00661 family)
LFTTSKINKRILIAPLDWGLGHATRCIPVIKQLVDSGCDVWVATSGAQETVLKEAFPALPFLHLPGYKVHYGKYGVMLQLLRQIPVIRRHIFTENAWLQQAIVRYGFDGIISDNRYGLYSAKVPSVIITHQLALQLPPWASWFRQGITNILYRHIAPFGACWIPDVPDASQSLAGDMSHPISLPELPISYIGWLSRFQTPDINIIRENAILISLSGPEPQRSLLEEKILAQIGDIEQPVWLLRGLPGQTEKPIVPAHVTVFNHLPAQPMQELMARCQLLISRSGYSTLMDAMVMGTPIACIPTPGQTEQEYLAGRIEEKKWGISRNQNEVNLKEMMAASKKLISAHSKETPDDLLLPVMKTWLEKL